MDSDSRYESIITSIVGVAVYQVEGVAALSTDSGKSFSGKLFRGTGKSVLVTTLKDNQVIIDISINAYYGHKIPDLAYNVQNKVKEEVEKATNYKVKSVNISVVGVVFPS
ncbi:MAG: Asp23/Gls24 family envelope stress response protein [Clostridia bacterium]|nr:Asp23/Gls24 family envelope stress response protein [Clostridia bacterium]